MAKVAPNGSKAKKSPKAKTYPKRDSNTTKKVMPKAKKRNGK